MTAAVANRRLPPNDRRTALGKRFFFGIIHPIASYPWYGVIFLACFSSGCRARLRPLRQRAVLIAGGCSLAVGLIGGAVCSMAGGRASFYCCLWLPPAALPRFFMLLFWCAAYFAVGCAAGIVLQCPPRWHDQGRQNGLLFYCAMMGAGLLWAPLFFCVGAFFLSFLLVCAVAFLSFCMMRCFFSVNRLAGWIAAGYLVWLGYCLYLSFFIFIYNG